MTIYNTNVDIFNDNVHTNFGLNKSIRSQIIEQIKLNSDINQGPYFLLQFAKNIDLQ